MHLKVFSIVLVIFLLSFDLFAAILLHGTDVFSLARSCFDHGSCSYFGFGGRGKGFYIGLGECQCCQGFC
jgi:hypothetical protein